jgi:hypothetical protein
MNDSIPLVLTHMIYATDIGAFPQCATESGGFLPVRQ